MDTVELCPDLGVVCDDRERSGDLAAEPSWASVNALAPGGGVSPAPIDP